MEKTEYKVGEVFQCGLVKLKVVQGNEDECEKCFFDKLCAYKMTELITGDCCSRKRQDNNDVYFVKVED